MCHSPSSQSGRLYVSHLQTETQKEPSKINPGSPSNAMIYSDCYGLVISRVHIEKLCQIWCGAKMDGD
jgi:hypothetical protein